MALSATVSCLSQPLAAVSGKVTDRRDGCCYLGISSMFSRKANSSTTTRELTVTNVASPQRLLIVPLPEKENVVDDHNHRRNHVAWTSVRQERWDGELVVEGEIPLWLVCLLYKLLAIYTTECNTMISIKQSKDLSLQSRLYKYRSLRSIVHCWGLNSQSKF